MGQESGGSQPRPARPTPARDFEAAYAGTPPWDIGRPQSAFRRLADQGRITGAVLDVGCGTGEHALLAAELGLPATGIDSAPTAIARAREKAAGRGLDARFVLGDALDLAALGEQFDTVLDCGLFHVLSDPQREPYAAGLRAVLRPGGRYFLLGFSDAAPGEGGPRRLTRDEIVASFRVGWRLDDLERTTIDTNLPQRLVPAWLAGLTRME